MLPGKKALYLICSLDTCIASEGNIEYWTDLEVNNRDVRFSDFINLKEVSFSKLIGNSCCGTGTPAALIKLCSFFVNESQHFMHDAVKWF